MVLHHKEKRNLGNNFKSDEFDSCAVVNTAHWTFSHVTGKPEVEGNASCPCVRRKGPKKECPDYKTAGPNSCHFDGRHTAVWHVYCMNVTAVTAARNYTSRQHCLDVADIGEGSASVSMETGGGLPLSGSRFPSETVSSSRPDSTFKCQKRSTKCRDMRCFADPRSPRVSAVETEPPVNLTYELSDAGGDETGHNALLTWKYPEPADLQYGWITLVYELEYKRDTEPDNWKVRLAPWPRPPPIPPPPRSPSLRRR